MMELDRQEAERLKEMRITEEKLNEQIESTQALKFLGQNEKNSKFRNKKQDELTKL